jgi:hypothetical protein
MVAAETVVKDIKPTVSKIFFIYPLKIPAEHLVDNNLLNAYSHDSMNDHSYEDAVYLLFKPSNMDRFREFLDSEYERSDNILEDYDYGKFVVVVYKMDSKYNDDYALIREGRYSKASLAFQKEFPRIKKIIIKGLHKDELSLQFRIFNKTGDLIDFWEDKFGMKFDDNQELWEGYNKEKETLTEEVLREYE